MLTAVPQFMSFFPIMPVCFVLRLVGHSFDVFDHLIMPFNYTFSVPFFFVILFFVKYRPGASLITPYLTTLDFGEVVASVSVVFLLKFLFFLQWFCPIPYD